MANTTGTYQVKAGAPITYRSFAIQLLNSLGIHPNDQNVKALIAWQQAEGGSVHNGAKWNPLNVSGSGVAKTYHGKLLSNNAVAFGNFLDGLNATSDTLRHSRYDAIRSALQTGNADQIATAIEKSPWSTSHYGGNGIRTILHSANFANVGSVVLGKAKEGLSLVDQALTSSPADALADKLKPFEFLTKLSEGQMWVRILYVVGGLILGLVGILLITGRSISNVIPQAKMAKTVAGVVA